MLPAVTMSWFCSALIETAVEGVVVLTTEGCGAHAKPLFSCAVSVFENVPFRFVGYCAVFIRLTRPGDGATSESWELSSYHPSVPLMQTNAPRAVPVSWPVQVSLPPPCGPLPELPQERQSSAAANIVSLLCMSSSSSGYTPSAAPRPRGRKDFQLGQVCFSNLNIRRRSRRATPTYAHVEGAEAARGKAENR